MHQFGWLSERVGNFFNLLQKEGALRKGKGGSNPGENHGMVWDVIDDNIKIIIPVVDVNFHGMTTFYILIILSTYFILRSSCLSNFLCNEIILDVAIDLLFGNVTMSSFHKWPTEYLSFSSL